MELFKHFRNSPPAIGLALSGGATHGAAHIGVLQVLEREGIKPAFVAGTSAGALIGAAYCSGVPLDEIQRLFLSLEWPDLLKVTIRPHLSFFDAQPLETFLRAKIGEHSFADLKIPFVAIACDLNNGEKVVLDHGPLAPAIRASSAFPAIFSPVEIDDRLLVDGGIVDNLPVDEVRKMGAKFIIACDVSKRGQMSKKPENPVEVLLTSIYIMQARGAYFSADDCDCYIRPEISSYSAWGFKDSLAVLEAGKTAAEMILPELLQKLKNCSSFSINKLLKQ